MDSPNEKNKLGKANKPQALNMSQLELGYAIEDINHLVDVVLVDLKNNKDQEDNITYVFDILEQIKKTLELTKKNNKMVKDHHMYKYQINEEISQLDKMDKAQLITEKDVCEDKMDKIQDFYESICYERGKKGSLKQKMQTLELDMLNTEFEIHRLKSSMVEDLVSNFKS